MYCKKCGTKLREEDLFCPKCGEKVAPEADNKTQQAAAQPLQTVPQNPTVKPSGNVVLPNPQPTPEPEKVQEQKRPNKGKMSKKIIAVVCALAIVSGSVCAGFYFFQKKEKVFNNLSDARFIYMDEAITDAKISDEKSALAALGEVKNIIGVENIEQLKVKEARKVGENTYYRFQQYIDDVPVLGRSVVVGADADNNSTGLTANTCAMKTQQKPQDYPSAQAVSQAIEQTLSPAEQSSKEQQEATDPTKQSGKDEQATTAAPSESEQTTTQEDASGDEENTAAISRQISENIADSIGQTQFSVVPKGDAYTYYLQDDGEAVLVYELYVGTSETIYYVLIQAQDGSVLLCDDCLSEVSVEVFAKDKSVSATGWQEGDTYSLYNEKQHINVFDFKGFDTAAYNKENKKDKENVEEDFIKYGFQTISSKKNAFDTNAVKLLNLTQALDGYFRNLGDEGFDYIHAAVNDGYDKGKNARGGSIMVNGDRRAVILLGKNYPADKIDVTAHEYTHAITQTSVHFISTEQNQMPGAISEGISDIFGILAEQAYTHASEPDWQMDDLRNVRDPQAAGYPVLPTDENHSKEKDYAHPYSTVISHTAYLMWNGIDGNEAAKIDSVTLAQLWYHALQWMQSDCTFSQCACAVQIAANTMYKNGALTREQLDCVKNAFRTSQIALTPQTSSKTANGKFTLQVLNYNGGEAVSYSYKVYRLPAAAEWQSDLKALKKGTSNKSELALSLDPGEYLIRLADDAADQNATVFELRLHVDESAADAADVIKVQTDFTEVLTEPDANEAEQAKPAFETTYFGNVVSDGESVYYWKYNANSFTQEEVLQGNYYFNEKTENELIKRDEQGKETVLLKDTGAGNLCLANGRLYYSLLEPGASIGYNTFLQIKSCKLDGSDEQMLQKGVLLGVMEQGQYLVIQERQENPIKYTIKTVDLKTQDEHVIHESTSLDNLACNDHWLIFKSDNGDNIPAAERKYEIFKANATGSEITKIHEVKVTDLSSIQNILEWNNDLVGLSITINNPYIYDNMFYYTFDHIEGTARIIMSFNAYQIDLRDNSVVQLDTEDTWLEGGGVDYSKVGNKEYARYLTQKDDCAKRGDFSAYVKGQIGVSGDNPDISYTVVNYCEIIGKKQYVFLITCNFSQYLAWKPGYIYENCAMFEIDSETGETTMLYATK